MRRWCAAPCKEIVQLMPATQASQEGSHVVWCGLGTECTPSGCSHALARGAAVQFRTLKKRTRSRSCSAIDSFCTSLKKNSALATSA
jgi:hypothetical protein